MNPSVRVLQVMEYLMDAGSNPVKQVDIARDLGISPATLNRIIKTLSEQGYILRSKEKYCVPNFRLTRNVPMSERYLSNLNKLMEEVTQKYRVSVEIVVVSGFDLFWHSRTELPDATVAIRATRGFQRNLYELDALSRLYLGRVGWDEVSYKLFPGGFFETGLEMDSLAPAEAKRIIEASATKIIDYDFDGNHLGVRRFATIIEDDEGHFIHLLSFAEAAVPVRDEATYISEYMSVLSEIRSNLQKEVRKEVKAKSSNSQGIKKYELHSPHIG